MVSKKMNVRARGKLPLSQYFKKLKNGDKVAVIVQQSTPSAYPKRIVGKSGVIIGSRGTSMIVKISDGNLPKQYIIKPIHLKKLK
jgi:ribosomal protein L21E